MQGINNLAQSEVNIPSINMRTYAQLACRDWMLYSSDVDFLSVKGDTTALPKSYMDWSRTNR